jgi:hypothetical protein
VPLLPVSDHPCDDWRATTTRNTTHSLDAVANTTKEDKIPWSLKKEERSLEAGEIAETGKLESK